MTKYQLTLLAFVALLCTNSASIWAQGTDPSMLSLDFRLLPRENTQRMTPKLDISHAEIGPVCELQCYETGPFQHGDAKKNPDGSVVFSYTSGNMTATTTFTIQGDDRVQAHVLVKGPLDELKSVNYLGPCLQFQRSREFTRQGPLQEFAARCFMYTMRGPVKLLDAARGTMTRFRPDAPENNPPMVQWYVPVDRPHPGSIWGVVGAAGDRPTLGLIGCTSRDGKWLAAYAAKDNLNIGQLYMPCIHVLPDASSSLDESEETISYRETIYVMPNDSQRLYEAYRQDYPAEGATFAASPDGDSIELRPADESPRIKLRFAFGSGEWQSKWWEALVCADQDSRCWACPHDDVLELCVAFKPGTSPANIRDDVTWAGEGWSTVGAPAGVRARVLESADGKWTAALFWEHDGVPAESEPGGSHTVRGKLWIVPTESLDLAGRIERAQLDWENAMPHHAPVDDAP